MKSAEATHPLAETLAQFIGDSHESPDLHISFGPVSGPGWYLAADLPADEAVLDEVLERYGGCRKTGSPFLRAALLMHPYIKPVMSAAIFGLYGGRRVPDVSAENIAIRLAESGEIVEHALITCRFAALSSDDASSHPDAIPVPDWDSLVAWMFDRMVERHMQPLFSHLTRKTRLSGNVMWTGLAGSCAGALMTLQRAGYFTVDEALTAKATLLDRGPSPLRERVSVYPLESGEHRGLFMRMEVCCQKYLHPELGKCGYCGLRPIPEQLDMQQSFLDRRVAALQHGCDASQ